jgi:hypothetical protein
MSTMKWFGRLLLGGALLAVTVPGALQAQEGGTFVTYDQELVKLAEEIPGFGGLWRDGRGQTHAYLLDLSRAREVQHLDPAGVEVHQGQYDVRDLAAWKDELRPLLGREDAVSLDLDEASNRLRLVVERGAEAGMEEALRSVRVPREAVILEAGEPVEPFESLTDRIRPVPGGVRIRSSGGGCTHGFNVLRGNVRGFVTNSHCSAVRGSVEGTVFFQKSNLDGADRVGVETVDPKFFTGGSCPSGRKCRYSDAIFVDYDSNALSAGLKIANPSFCTVGAAGPLTVNPAKPRLTITGATYASSGAVVAKVGATTGCTFGSVQATCADVNVKNTAFTMLCQEMVAGFAAKGDSGSPVFLHGGDGATVVGLLWGGSPGFYVFSSWMLVQAELGFPVLVP